MILRLILTYWLIAICFVAGIAAGFANAPAPAKRVRYIDLDTGHVWVQPIDKKTGEYAVTYKPADDGGDDDDGDVAPRMSLEKWAPPLKIVDVKGKLVAEGKR